MYAGKSMKRQTLKRFILLSEKHPRGGFEEPIGNLRDSKVPTKRAPNRHVRNLEASSIIFYAFFLYIATGAALGSP